MNQERRDKLKGVERIKQAKKRFDELKKYNRSTGITLRDLADLRNSADYDQVKTLLSLLQTRRITGQILTGDDFDAIDAAHRYLNDDEVKKKLEALSS